MKKSFFAAIAVFCFFCACNNPFSPSPVIPREDIETKDNVPENLTATQGGKRFIELNFVQV